MGPSRGPIQRHFDLHSRPSNAQIIFRYQDTLKAAYRLYSEYDANLGRLSVPSEQLPRLEALDEELFYFCRVKFDDCAWFRHHLQQTTAVLPPDVPQEDVLTLAAYHYLTSIGK